MSITSKIFHNAVIHTVDAQNRTFSALMVEGDRIAALGSDADILSRRRTDTELVDLRGKTLIPGFYDAHSHIFQVAELRHSSVDLSSPPIGPHVTVEDCLARLREKAAHTPAGEWVRGYAYDDARIAEKRYLTRHDLDRVSPAHPVLVQHFSMHMGMMNTRALERVGYGESCPDPEGGCIRREEGTRVPSGVLEEEAFMGMLGRLPGPGFEDYAQALSDAARDYAALGITTANDAFTNKDLYLEGAKRAVKRNRLPIRISWTPYLADFDTLKNLSIDTPLLRRNGVKIFQDGSLPGFTAHLTRPYHTPFKGQSDWRGYPRWPQEELNAHVLHYHRRGVQCIIHTNGDAATDYALNAIENALAHYPAPDPRFLIVHAQCIRDDQIERCARLGVSLTLFALHVYYFGDRHEKYVLGPERAGRLDPMRSALNAGIVVSAHCDTPVLPMSPLFSMWCCVNRKTHAGKILGARERVTPEQALRAHTYHAAWQHRDEQDKGSLEPGKYADMAVLDADPLACDPDRIRHIQVLETIVGGKSVYVKSTGDALHP